jgi:hypothetical protein
LISVGFSVSRLEIWEAKMLYSMLFKLNFICKVPDFTGFGTIPGLIPENTSIGAIMIKIIKNAKHKPSVIFSNKLLF